MRRAECRADQRVLQAVIAQHQVTDEQWQFAKLDENIDGKVSREEWLARCAASTPSRLHIQPIYIRVAAHIQPMCVAVDTAH